MLEPSETSPDNSDAKKGKAEINGLAEAFARFSQIEAPVMSPFYASLAAAIAEDPEVLAVASHVKPGQPPANMLLGAVRLLLENGVDPALFALYPDQKYPDQTKTALTADAYPPFRKFTLKHQDAIQKTISGRSVQSNVVRRAAVLLLGLMHVSDAVENRPFVSIEIGASLGLTLLWRSFDYDFGDGREIVADSSPVTITTRLSGAAPSVWRGAFPEVTESIGIELEPLSVDNPDDIAWLNALIWPEHDDNRRHSELAVELLREQRPRVIEGDALDVMPALIAEQDAHAPIVVYHSHTLNQMAAPDRRRFDEMLLAASRDRPVFRLAFEGERGHSALRLFGYSNGQDIKETHLADCEAHGRWIEWLAG